MSGSIPTMALHVFRLPALAVAMLLLCNAPALALKVGDTANGFLAVEGKDIPLPQGEHTVVATGFADILQPGRGSKVKAADFGPVRRIVLARQERGRIVDVVEIIVNTLAYPDGWGIASECTRKDIYATLTRHKSGWDVSCLWVQPVIDGIDRAGIPDAQLRSFADSAKALLPDFWVESGFRVANRQDLVEVRYRFAGLVKGADTNKPATAVDAAKWHPAEIEKHPSELAFVKDVAIWASAVYPSVESGLRAPLEKGVIFSTPFRDIPERKPSDRDARLAKLAALHTAGAVSAEEYARQQAVIASEVEPVLESTWTQASVAGWKAGTYRAVVTTINAGIDYIFIGQPFAAGVLVILQVFVNTTKFFFHEVMWQELFGVGPLGRDEPRLIDFVAAGSA